MKTLKIFLILLIIILIILGTLFLIGILPLDKVIELGLRISGILGLLFIGIMAIVFLSGIGKTNDSPKTQSKSDKN